MRRAKPAQVATAWRRRATQFSGPLGVKLNEVPSHPAKGCDRVLPHGTAVTVKSPVKVPSSVVYRIVRAVCFAAALAVEDLDPGTILAQTTDPLPSWNDGPAKQAILDLVRATTEAGSPDFVPPEERLATFDQDGTLWVEHPIYSQVVFALDRVVALAPEHPEWKKKEPFKTVLSGDHKAMEKLSLRDLEEIVFATHAGMTVEAFNTIAADWAAKATDHRWHKPYTELVYQPMQEVLALLRAHGYRTYIVTGGGQAFVRAYADRVYGVAPAEVIGSSLETGYKYDAKGQAELIREPKLELNNNNLRQGRGHLPVHRPAAAGGVRQLDRRPADAGVDHGRQGQAAGHAGAARRQGARIRLRPGRGPAGHQGRHLHPGAVRRGQRSAAGW